MVTKIINLKYSFQEPYVLDFIQTEQLINVVCKLYKITNSILNIHIILLIKAIAIITLTPYMVLPRFATRFAEYTGGIRVSFTQPRLF